MTKCPKCNGQDFVKDGIRTTKKHGSVQTYLCRKCGYRFSTNSTPLGVLTSAEMIAEVVSRLKRGMTTRQVAKETGISHATVHRYGRKFGGGDGQTSLILELFHKRRTKKAVKARTDEMEDLSAEIAKMTKAAEVDIARVEKRLGIRCPHCGR